MDKALLTPSSANAALTEMVDSIESTLDYTFRDGGISQTEVKALLNRLGEAENMLDIASPVMSEKKWMETRELLAFLLKELHLVQR